MVGVGREIDEKEPGGIEGKQLVVCCFVAESNAPEEMQVG